MYKKNLLITILILCFLTIGSSSTTYINSTDDNIIITYDNLHIDPK